MGGLDAPPEEIQIIPFGTHITDKGEFVLSEDDMKTVIEEFGSHANDMVIDYEHQSCAGVEAPAAGWITSLLNKGKEGLWAVVEWTPRAREYLAGREYRYLSPVFLKRASDNRVVRLLGAALTNTPAIDGMVPVVNKNQGSRTQRPGKEVNAMTKFLSALGLTAGSSEEEALKALEALKAKFRLAAAPEVLAELGLGGDASESEVLGVVSAMKQAVRALEASQAEAAELKARLARKEAEETVSLAMKAGKLTPAQGEWARSYAERDPEGFGVFVERAPVVVPRGEFEAPGAPRRHGSTDALQLSVNKLLMVSDETFRKFSSKED